MKSKRKWLFRALTICLLLAIAGTMFIIGRGHTIYLDNKTIDYEGQTYEGPYQIVVYVDDEQVAKLNKRDRGMATCIGQGFNMVLEITQEKGGEAATMGVTMTLPYNMDGIIINLPALLAGLPQDAYLEQFVPAVPDVPEDEEIVTDELEMLEAVPEV
ncbi:MAG: hypothetical protein Q4E65_06810 [Clostridia bacterium]|nr:hypothetical protein [Clostridia bacterium]